MLTAACMYWTARSKSPRCEKKDRGFHMSGQGGGRYASIGKHIKHMIFSVEFLVAALLQIPLLQLRDWIAIPGFTRFFPMLSILVVYFAGGFIRKKLNLRSVFRD